MMNEDEYKISIGKLVKKTRRSNQISQEEYAAQVGLHRTYIGMIERGDQNLSLMNLVKIAEDLDLSLSQFFKAAEKLGSKPDNEPVMKAGRKPKAK